MKRLMILFANGFPYNRAEPFLEHEVPLYRSYFDKVLVISSCQRSETSKCFDDDSLLEFLPDHTLSKDPRSLLTAIPLTLSDPMFYRELRLLFQNGFRFNRLHDLIVMSLCANHRAALARRWLSCHPEYHLQVLYSYWMHIPAYAAVRLKQTISCSCPAVTRAHGYDLYAHQSRTGYQPFHRQIFDRIDLVAAVSEDGKQDLVRRYGQSEKVTVHRLGAVDHRSLNPIADRSTLRIVSCSRVVPVKRLTRIADALAQFPDRPVHWTHLGSGEGLDALKQYAARHLPDHVTADFPGALPNEQIYAFYKHTPVHVFLNVSSSEGLPVAAMEAMSFGIPVIATAVGGTPELVRHEANGYLLPMAFDDAQLTAYFRQLLMLSDAEYETMRLTARETYEQNFRIPDNYHRFLTAISDIGRDL